MHISLNITCCVLVNTHDIHSRKTMDNIIPKAVGSLKPQHSGALRLSTELLSMYIHVHVHVPIINCQLWTKYSS